MVLQAQWAYNISVIQKLLWPLQEMQIDGLVGFTGPNRVLSALADEFRKA